jgi:transcriptional regulator with XRE-family HTH domain
VLHNLGEHIRERRLDACLKKKQLARQFFVDKTTIHNWEDKGITPSLRFIPRIIEFLGYDPADGGAPPCLGERLRFHRRRLGLSRKRLSGLLGVDESSLAGWETGKHKPTRKSLKLITELLDSTFVGRE